MIKSGARGSGILRAALITGGLFVAPVFGQEKEKSAADLAKTADGTGVRHERSATALSVPKEWKMAGDGKLGAKTSFLKLRREQPSKIDVTVYWAPLTGKFEQRVETERALLIKFLGETKVGARERVRVGAKAGYAIAFDGGPMGNPSQSGIVYFFEAGTAANRWRIKVHAIVENEAKAESLKAVRALLDQFQWTLANG